METHRIAVDSIGDGTSETYCGLIRSAFDDDFHDNHTSQDPTCAECRALMLQDRAFGFRKGPRKDDPEWLKKAFE